MNNEAELTIKHFEKKEIATRRELWDKIEQLKSELEEMKKNAIVPKFKIGDEGFAIIPYKVLNWSTYGFDIASYRIEKICIKEIFIKKTKENKETKYFYEEFSSIEEQNLFSTKAEAEEALRKAEGKC